MSIKTEIMNLIASEEGEIRLAENVTLSRWTENPVGDVDALVVTVKCPGCPNGVIGAPVYIDAREYDAIMDEIEQAIYDVYEVSAKKIASAIKNGYKS